MTQESEEDKSKEYTGTIRKVIEYNTWSCYAITDDWSTDRGEEQIFKRSTLSQERDTI
jgi:hypothetical protein